MKVFHKSVATYQVDVGYHALQLAVMTMMCIAGQSFAKMEKNSPSAMRMEIQLITSEILVPRFVEMASVKKVKQMRSTPEDVDRMRHQNALDLLLITEKEHVQRIVKMKNLYVAMAFVRAESLQKDVILCPNYRIYVQNISFAPKIA